MSLTEKVEKKINELQDELKKVDNNFKNVSQEKIFELLNKRENICTPSFILRRQIQIKFPKILEESGVKDYADLVKLGNIAWEPELIEALSKILSGNNFERFGKNNLDIDPKQWKNYLSDSARCQRNTAIKLIFALEMDELTAEKFLLANSHELLSLRNPFDYACKVCLKCNFTYTDAENLFYEFDKQRDKSQFIDKIQESPDDDFTHRIKNETTQLIKNDTISFEDLKNPILQTMLKYQKSFRLSRNDSGYSFGNVERFKVLLKYLTLLYPKVEMGVGSTSSKYYFKQVEIKKKADGTPKTPQHLIISMLDSQEIDLPEYVELPEYGGPSLEERGAAKRAYDKIPFTKNVLIPLRSLDKNIRSILRVIKNPENSAAVSRDTVLFLTYFLITGWLFAEEEHKEKFLDALDKDLQTSEDGTATSEMLFILDEFSDAMDAVRDNEEIPAEIYINLMNRILTPFEFVGFYAPFVLDRFILICLMSLKYFNEEYFMQMIISESYRLSLDYMEKEANNK